ncbi:hypothetical protein HXX76_011016 [Chlamydomonas incerta]|uniref:histidine kinase n=1 Tax=Chlamydomonas incerta TaxID=51695 RepID=A0A835SL92_CHLIN|nr:hypothetical protein HXX76_011016 [Chlamydomonas incerta]|eukprot:KAG2429247.1 hypothetical protein HXX76_011016 [Chlamydomonas incerta]
MEQGLDSHPLALTFSSAALEGEYLASVARRRWPVLVFIFCFDVSCYLFRITAKLIKILLDAEPAGLLRRAADLAREFVPQLANMAVLYLFLGLLNRRSRRLGDKAARQEEVLLSVCMAFAICNLLASLSADNSSDYVYVAFFLICTSTFLKIRWWVGTAIQAVPAVLMQYLVLGGGGGGGGGGGSGLRGLAAAAAAAASPQGAANGTFGGDGSDGGSSGPSGSGGGGGGGGGSSLAALLPPDAAVHVAVAWAVGGLMAYLADWYQRQMFAHSKLAALAHSSEMTEAQARIAAQRALAAAQAQAAQRALSVAREKAANEAKSEFMSLMCHEVRTPLNGCLASAEMLLETPLAAEQRELAATIRVSGSILLSTVSNFLDFFKLEAGKALDIVRTATDLRRLVAEVHCIVEAMVGRGGEVALLEPHLDGPLAAGGRPVYCDADRVRGILLNLYTNAAKFTKAGHIQLRLREVPPGYAPEPAGGYSAIVVAPPTYNNHNHHHNHLNSHGHGHSHSHLGGVGAGAGGGGNTSGSGGLGAVGVAGAGAGGRGRGGGGGGTQYTPRAGSGTVANPFSQAAPAAPSSATPTPQPHTTPVSSSDNNQLLRELAGLGAGAGPGPSPLRPQPRPQQEDRAADAAPGGPPAAASTSSATAAAGTPRRLQAPQGGGAKGGGGGGGGPDVVLVCDSDGGAVEGGSSAASSAPHSGPREGSLGGAEAVGGMARALAAGAAPAAEPGTAQEGQPGPGPGPGSGPSAASSLETGPGRPEGGQAAPQSAAPYGGAVVSPAARAGGAAGGASTSGGPGGTDVELESEPRWLLFEVADTGVGITPEGLKALFREYVQGTEDEMRKPRSKGGTGLGLSICSKQVGVLGGRIGAYSAAGRGSVFWFTIPLIAAAVPPPPPAPPVVETHGAAAVGSSQQQEQQWAADAAAAAGASDPCGACDRAAGGEGGDEGEAGGAAAGGRAGRQPGEPAAAPAGPGPGGDGGSHLGAQVALARESCGGGGGGGGGGGAAPSPSSSSRLHPHGSCAGELEPQSGAVLAAGRCCAADAGGASARASCSGRDGSTAGGPGVASACASAHASCSGRGGPRAEEEGPPDVDSLLRSELGLDPGLGLEPPPCAGGRLGRGSDDAAGCYSPPSTAAPSGPVSASGASPAASPAAGGAAATAAASGLRPGWGAGGTGDGGGGTGGGGGGTQPGPLPFVPMPASAGRPCVPSASSSAAGTSMSALLAAGQLGSAPHPAHMSVLRGGGSTGGLRLSNGGASTSGGPAGAGGAGRDPGAAGGGGGGEAGGALSGRRVLLVEDNLINQTVARKMLASLGLRCEVASNGLEAVQAVEKVLAAAAAAAAADPTSTSTPTSAAPAAHAAMFDVVLMDMAMPVMGGVDATRAIRRLGSAVPILAMTANASDRDRDACFEAGMDGFLTKPILRAALAEALVKVLESTAATAAAAAAAAAGGAT